MINWKKKKIQIKDRKNPPYLIRFSKSQVITVNYQSTEAHLFTGNI